MSVIQGAFRKHQCAVQIKYGINVPNASALSLEDKKKLFAVARGKPSSCPDSFLMDMTDTSNSTEINLSSNNPLENEISVNEDQHSVILTTEAPLQQNTSTENKDLFTI
jgi:hypothetical protein